MLCGAPVVWRSTLQSITAQSTCEAEYVAANSAAREAEWCRMMYDDVLQGNYVNGKPGADLKLPLLLMEDNQGCIALAKNFMVTARTKHFRLRWHYIRQQVRDGVIRMEYIPTKENTADLFTKILPPVDFKRHRDTMIKVKNEPSTAAVENRSNPAAAVRTVNRATMLTTPSRSLDSLKKTMSKYWNRRNNTNAIAAGARTIGKNVKYVRQAPMVLHA